MEQYMKIEYETKYEIQYEINQNMKCWKYEKLNYVERNLGIMYKKQIKICKNNTIYIWI